MFGQIWGSTKWAGTRRLPSSLILHPSPIVPPPEVAPTTAGGAKHVVGWTVTKKGFESRNRRGLPEPRGLLLFTEHRAVPSLGYGFVHKKFFVFLRGDEEKSKGGSESVHRLLPGKIGKKDGKSGVPLSNNKEQNWQRARVREEMEEDLRKPPPKDRVRDRGGVAEKLTEDGREREQCEPCEGSLPIAPEREEAQRT